MISNLTSKLNRFSEKNPSLLRLMERYFL